MTRRAPWTYDAQADCGYITLFAGEIARTQELTPNIVVDLDADGQVVGIKLISIKHLTEAPA